MRIMLAEKGALFSRALHPRVAKTPDEISAASPSATRGAGGLSSGCRVVNGNHFAQDVQREEDEVASGYVGGLLGAGGWWGTQRD